MSKLTLEEAAERLEGYRQAGQPSRSLMESLRLGSSALRYQERHRWKKLDEEKPPINGKYFTYSPPHAYIDEHYRISRWSGGQFDMPRKITYWKYIDSPEEEVE